MSVNASQPQRDIQLFVRSQVPHLVMLLELLASQIDSYTVRTGDGSFFAVQSLAIELADELSSVADLVPLKIDFVES